VSLALPARRRWRSAMRYATGEHLMAKGTGRRNGPLTDEVSRLAYLLYEARGRIDGHDVDDWLLAEQQLKDRYSETATSNIAAT